jgi:predicted Zn-dependent protease
LVAIRDTAPHTRRHFHDPRRRRARLGLTMVALAVALVLSGALYAWGIPAASNLVARWVPVAWEDRVGASVVDQFVPVAKRCADPAAQVAIDVIMRRLLAAAGPVPYRFRVVVANIPAANALAAPGGHLVVFRGLLDQSRSPEELAGVLAHEIQHVLERHSTRLILQHASTALVVTTVLGDVSGVASVAIEGARVFGTMAYSRAHEAEADEAGLRLLLAARIDPAGLIGMFDGERVDGAGGALRYFASHPPSAERAATLRRLAGTAPPTFTPVLDEAGWTALRAACRAGTP